MTRVARDGRAPMGMQMRGLWPGTATCARAPKATCSETMFTAFSTRGHTVTIAQESSALGVQALG